mmetsp:Transcript_25457/g.49756  ORF Transcript_25457/g.49756 Transcript_25457/m.49756 type:complete len:136 (+) Transcript_25457:236-643(+)
MTVTYPPPPPQVIHAAHAGRSTRVQIAIKQAPSIVSTVPPHLDAIRSGGLHQLELRKKQSVDREPSEEREKERERELRKEFQAPLCLPSLLQDHLDLSVQSQRTCMQMSGEGTNGKETNLKQEEKLRTNIRSKST